MSAPVRFLAIAVVSWVGFRAAANALLPEPLPMVPFGAAMTPIGVASTAPAVPGALSHAGQAYAVPQSAYPYPAGYPSPYAQPYPQALAYGPPMRVPVPMPITYYPYGAQPALLPYSEGMERPVELAELDFSGMPPAFDPLLSAPAPVSRPVGLATKTSPPGPPRLDRWSLTGWTVMRQQQQIIDPRAPDIAPEAALATSGTLGGSQAGARLAYRFSPAVSANLRVSAPIQAQQQKMAGEAALGVAWQPLQSVPVRLMAERRQRFGVGGGRNAFALLAEGGVYQRPLPFGLQLDGYAQSGIVDVRRRDWFVDGAVTATRPLLGRFAIGAGAWGGAQKGLNRFDVGPRVSMQVRPGIKAHLDYRQRLIGSAEPGSGWAMTLGADF